MSTKDPGASLPPPGGPTAVAPDIVSLMEDGWFDVTVRRLRARHPDLSADVPDAVASAVLKLVSRDPGKGPVRDLKGYLYQAAQNTIYDLHKRQQKLAFYEPEDDEDFDALDPEQEALRKEAVQQIRAVVRAWPNRNMREYMLLYLDSLYYDEPLTIADAAAQLSDLFGEVVSKGSIGTWKRRGLAQLVRDFEADGRDAADADYDSEENQ